MIYSFDDRRPKIGVHTYISPQALIIGDVNIEDHCYVGPGTILRGDYGSITIGSGTAVEEGVIIHAAPSQLCKIGAHVTLGHGAVIHCEQIEDYAVIGMGAILSLDSQIGTWAIVAEGSVVKRKQRIPHDTVVAGSPAKEIRKVSAHDKSFWLPAKQLYVDLATKYLSIGLQPIPKDECI